MSVEVKYAVATNSMHAKEPKQATIDSASYDVFAAESKTLLLHVVTPISLELHFEIPNEYFGNIYTRFVLLAKYWFNRALIFFSYLVKMTSREVHHVK